MIFLLRICLTNFSTLLWKICSWGSGGDSFLISLLSLPSPPGSVSPYLQLLSQGLPGGKGSAQLGGPAPLPLFGPVPIWKGGRLSVRCQFLRAPPLYNY